MPGGARPEQLSNAVRALVALLITLAALCGVVPHALAQTPATHITAELVAERGSEIGRAHV